jgi:hypothetical protein
MLERHYEAYYYLQIFSGRQGGSRKGIGISYKLVPVNNNYVGWFPLDELVLSKGIGVPYRLVPVNIIAGWCLQKLL